jgi:hypothetical protein
MLGKVKKWLGIEGVKLELILPEGFRSSNEEITGLIRFRSMHEQSVQKIKIFMIERYARGRRKNKTIDEYKMGELEMDVDVSVLPSEEVDVPFTISFERVKSEMDELEEKNFLFRGIVRTAKYLKGAKSSFWIEAEADVKGVALNPFDKKEIKMD